jgi:succinate dehydrogenase/fumarate reductase cytochrome b subunit
VVIAFYLYLHLAVLSMLLIGRSLGAVSSAGDRQGLPRAGGRAGRCLFHGLNGIRVALVGSGIAVSRERVLPGAESGAFEYRGGRSARVWHWTAGSGIALVALATMHIAAQHFVVDQKGGLRTYGEVLSYIGNPVIFVLETGFLFAVTIHAMLGIRGIMHDLDLSPRAARRLDATLWVVGTATVAYGVGLLITLAARN